MCRGRKSIAVRLSLRIACFVTALGIASPAGAQAPPLARLIPLALADAAETEPRPAPDDGVHHFVIGDLTPSPSELNAALALQMTTFPVSVAWEGAPATSLGAGRPELPAYRSVPRSSFAERATTLGQDSLSVGFTQQSYHYRALDGLDIESDEVRFFLEHNNCCGPSADPSAATDLEPAFERDLLEQALSVDMDRTVYAFAVGYGVTSRLDVGATLPLVKVNLRTRVTSRLRRTVTAGSVTPHRFDPLEVEHRTTYADGTAHGLGDIALRAKYALLETAGGGLAASVSVTLPTGDAANLLGSGVTRTEGRVIWSERFGGRWGAHVNGSYTRSTGDAADELGLPTNGLDDTALELTVPDEIGAVAGVDVPLLPRVAVSADLVMRHLRGLSRFDAGETRFPSRGPGRLPSAAFVAPDNLQVTGRETDVTQLFTAIGVRLHLGRALLLSADALFPVVDQGFVPRGVVVGFSMAQ
ncbi:MAG: transporter [Vicinamibacteraceae bacterium]